MKIFVLFFKAIVVLASNKNTCQDWQASGTTTSGDYFIYPDGITKISVYCDMSVTPAKTVVPHDLNTPIVVDGTTGGRRRSSGGRRRGSSTEYTDYIDYDIGYNDDVDDVFKLVERSTAGTLTITVQCKVRHFSEIVKRFTYSGDLESTWKCDPSSKLNHRLIY